ncbi:TATA element modulatory factor isoform X2 [Danaus plexippus]|uniref:TATA element modulatory factor isoform X2 n=1 Tax=Danaus plexippus TaxID=13037 RepID=UPI002AB29A93|nr:TATA element modulatory factor isoform X2 [Danaus plexippus]
MNWFDASGLTSLAKSALKEAQKTIDKALDIDDDSSEDQEEPTGTSTSKSTPTRSMNEKDNSDFFSSWGLTVSAESERENPIQEQPVVTMSPSKSNSQSLWGSFAGSFFEQTKSESETIVRPPKAKSMNLISDKYDSQDDLFSSSQLVMSDGGESGNVKKEVPKSEDRRDSTMSNVLSFMSSRNSSDSVEVLSQSLKSSPESEAASCHTISNSHSSSVGVKHNSESVEILPDSLVSPSSIECLGFDSYASDKNSSNSSNLSPGETSDKKSTPVGERTERAETADSVSLVADDDEDTMSYNSISECTAPTVLDTDDNSMNPFPKLARSEFKKTNERDLVYLEQPLASHKMQLSENSSNDGSWSDRTLNADNESVILEKSIEEQKKYSQEDVLIDKLSDSSSFYNVNVTSDLLQSESSAFVNVEKQQCSHSTSNDSSQRDTSVKERTSPVSSDSKSDLVKIGSDQTSGHTSGDELETATSSDIEIIPSPNGESSNGCRNSPGKYGFKAKVDGATSPNLVDLVLGKSLASKIRGHNRELSEASIQSNTSDDSQGSDNDKLMRRLCEMTEILDARESRLMEVSRNNAELAECNASLKSQIESLLNKHDGGDINTITEDYTQRMSALEKKFQQAIREKDQLRKQLDTLKSDTTRKNSSELENTIKEKDEMISQLQEEGEKLARHELQHTNIIKKLRAKEKDNEQVIKGLRDKIADQTSELERMKRCLSAKEELEVNQIEAVYRLTATNKTLEAELAETKSSLDDTTQRLATSRASLEAARRELAELQRGGAETTRLRDELQHAREEARLAREHAAALLEETRLLRTERRAEEQRWAAREEALRREVRAAAEARAVGEATDDHDTALLQQLTALQRAALAREQEQRLYRTALDARLAEAETTAAKAKERERLLREDNTSLAETLAEERSRGEEREERSRALEQELREARDTIHTLTRDLDRKTTELEQIRVESERQIEELRTRVSETEHSLAEEKAALDTERRRNAILQEQVSSRGDVSPARSVTSDLGSTSFWTEEAAGSSALAVEQALSQMTRQWGSRRGRDDVLARLAAERAALAGELAALRARLADHEHARYDELLQMYGEKEEQLHELRLDLHDVTQLYKQQLDELLLLRRRLDERT